MTRTQCVALIISPLKTVCLAVTQLILVFDNNYEVQNG